jgi:hypothetical protein
LTHHPGQVLGQPTAVFLASIDNGTAMRMKPATARKTAASTVLSGLVNSTVRPIAIA